MRNTGDDGRMDGGAAAYADDPRITAWALDELEGDERAEVEALLASDPRARAAADEARAAAASLTSALAAESLPRLDPARRAVIAARLAAAPAAEAPLPVAGVDFDPAEPATRAPLLPVRRLFPLPVGLAAAILLGVAMVVASRSVAPVDDGGGSGVANVRAPGYGVSPHVDTDGDGRLEFHGDLGTSLAEIRGRGDGLIATEDTGEAPGADPAAAVSGSRGASPARTPVLPGRPGHTATDAPPAAGLLLITGGRSGEGKAGGDGLASPRSYPSVENPRNGLASGGGGGGAELVRAGVEVTRSDSGEERASAGGTASAMYYAGAAGGGAAGPTVALYGETFRGATGTVPADSRQPEDPPPGIRPTPPPDGGGGTPTPPPGATAGPERTLVQRFSRLQGDGKPAIPGAQANPSDRARRLALPDGSSLVVPAPTNVHQVALLDELTTSVNGITAGTSTVADLAATRALVTRLRTEGLADTATLGYLEVLVRDAVPSDSTTRSIDPVTDNPFLEVKDAPLSTFSVDVDTAGYSVVRRMLRSGQRPPREGVRLEELVNYFPYAYSGPADGRPFAAHMAVSTAPWNPRHRLVRVALKGRMVDVAERPAANLVFLLDVSGSMNQPDKLPLLQKSLGLLVDRLQARDRVAIVVYAGAAGLVLPSTAGSDREVIRAALDRLSAGGSTNGGDGILLAYRTAEEQFVPGGINRVILATDGDFNVGVSDRAALVELIREKAKSKVFLTTLGFGMDNLKDGTLESLADRGNGQYAYVDSLREGEKVLAHELGATLQVIAKDVKIQVEFNPARVAAYRLLGYENRMLEARDFNDDAKDAGEIGAGHAVTALYEVVPAGDPVPAPSGVDPLRYQRPGGLTEVAHGDELLSLRLRWKEPEGDVSTLQEAVLRDGAAPFDGMDADFRFAASVAAFGMLLRESPHRGGASLDMVREIASGALADDPGGWRREFLALLDAAAPLVPAREPGR